MKIGMFVDKNKYPNQITPPLVKKTEVVESNPFNYELQVFINKGSILEFDSVLYNGY